ncbi:MAG TPA: hypothetical protein VGZ03_06145 [Acidimicrobiales bacterium]|jgi:hypothetical protein|nr:hypothetical protein [Acidimicrobiales bacterium]
MGFLDKVKEQATAAAAATKEAAAKGQSKLDEMQAKKAADGMLRDLGALSYGSVTNRETPTSEADATRLVAALQAHEAEHGEVSLALESPAGKQAS